MSQEKEIITRQGEEREHYFSPNRRAADVQEAEGIASLAAMVEK